MKNKISYLPIYLSGGFDEFNSLPYRVPSFNPTCQPPPSNSPPIRSSPILYVYIAFEIVQHLLSMESNSWWISSPPLEDIDMCPAIIWEWHRGRGINSLLVTLIRDSLLLVAPLDDGNPILYLGYFGCLTDWTDSIFHSTYPANRTFFGRQGVSRYGCAIFDMYNNFHCLFIIYWIWYTPVTLLLAQSTIGISSRCDISFD